MLISRSKRIYRNTSIWWETRYTIVIPRKVRVKPTMTKRQQFEPTIPTVTSQKYPMTSQYNFTQTWTSLSQLRMAWETQASFTRMMSRLGAKRKWVVASKHLRSHTKSLRLKTSSWPHLSSLYLKELSRTWATRLANLKSKLLNSNKNYRKKMLWSRNTNKWLWSPAEYPKKGAKVH